MKKTININLAGMAFTIEENAYIKLKNYLDAIEEELKKEQESDETFSDIEARIAELLIPVTKENEKVINVKFVDDIIKVMGSPEAFSLSDTMPDESHQTEETKPEVEHLFKQKRLYRDPYFKVIGGVCSGLGAYLGISPMLFRILFIVGVFSGLYFWISPFLYLVLWIAMPKAITIEQRVQMYGGDPALHKFKSSSSTKSFFKILLRVLAIIIGCILIVLVFALLNIFVFGLYYPIEWLRLLPGGMEIANTFKFLISDIPSLLTIGLGFFLGIPLILLFYLGLHLIFRFSKGGKFVGATSLVLWLASIVMILVGGLKMANTFKVRETIEKTYDLHAFSGNTLYLKQIDIPLSFKNEKHLSIGSRKFSIKNGMLEVSDHPFVFINRDSPELNLKITKDVSGRTSEEAHENALLIDYFWIQKDSILELDQIFTLAPKTWLSKQDVLIEIGLPADYEIVVDDKIYITDIKYKHIIEYQYIEK